MTDVFISYSRKDTEFVRRLHGVLSQLGRDVWVDWEDIPRGVDWLNEIHAAIEAADTFILVISPDALASEICNDEIYHAFAHNKRIIPIIHREIDERAIAGEWFDKSWETQARENWRGIKHLNWLFFRETDNFNGAVQTLLETIDTDIDHVQFHTRLLVRAREWEDRNRDEGFLLTGAEIAEARAWLAAAEHKSPPATALHRAYINRSHQTENVRQEQALRLERQAASRLRYLVGVLVVSLIVAIVLVIVSFTQFQNAQNEADSRATAQVDAESARAEINARLLLRSAQDAFRAGDVFLGIALALEAEPFDSVSELSRAVLSEIAVSPGPVAIFQDVDTGAVTSVALSPDRRLALASYADGRLRLWDVAQGIGTFTTPLFVSDVLDLDGINSVAFSADGQYAASAGCGVGNPDDNVCTAGQVILWQVVNEPQPTLQQVNMIGVLPEDNPESFAARTTSSEANAVVFDPDPRNAPIRLLAGYSSSSEGPFGILFVDEGETLRPREQIFNQDGDHSSDVITSIAMSASGGGILSGDERGGIRLWTSGPSNSPFAISGHSERITGLAFSPMLTSGFADTLVLSSSEDGTVRLSSRNQDQGFFTFTGHVGPVNGVVFTPDGRFGVTAGADGNLFVIDVDRASNNFGSRLFTLRPSQDTISIEALSFAFIHANDPQPETQFYAISGQSDGTMILWDMTMRDELPDGVETTEDLRAWLQANRFVRALTLQEEVTYLVRDTDDLTCQQRAELDGVEPLCD